MMLFEVGVVVLPPPPVDDKSAGLATLNAKQGRVEERFNSR